jgi:hypothetical protein
MVCFSTVASIARSDYESEFTFDVIYSDEADVPQPSSLLQGINRFQLRLTPSKTSEGLYSSGRYYISK